MKKLFLFQKCKYWTIYPPAPAFKICYLAYLSKEQNLDISRPFQSFKISDHWGPDLNFDLPPTSFRSFCSYLFVTVALNVAILHDNLLFTNLLQNFWYFLSTSTWCCLASACAGQAARSLGCKPHEELLLYIPGESLSLSHTCMWFYNPGTLCL